MTKTKINLNLERKPAHQLWAVEVLVKDLESINFQFDRLMEREISPIDLTGNTAVFHYTNYNWYVEAERLENGDIYISIS